MPILSLYLSSWLSLWGGSAPRPLGWGLVFLPINQDSYKIHMWNSNKKWDAERMVIRHNEAIKFFSGAGISQSTFLQSWQWHSLIICMNSVLVYFPLFLHPFSDSDEISVSLCFFNIPGNLKGKRTACLRRLDEKAGAVRGIIQFYKRWLSTFLCVRHLVQKE